MQEQKKAMSPRHSTYIPSCVKSPLPLVLAGNDKLMLNLYLVEPNSCLKSFCENVGCQEWMKTQLIVVTQKLTGELFELCSNKLQLQKMGGLISNTFKVINFETLLLLTIFDIIYYRKTGSCISEPDHIKYLFSATKQQAVNFQILTN